MTWENAQVVKRTEAVAHFIGLDEQPFSVVRFHKYEIPSCNYSTNVMVPQIFDEVNKRICNVVHEASVTFLNPDIQSLPETFQVWKNRYLYPYRQVLRSTYRYRISLKKKCYQTVHPYWLDSWDVEDLPPKKAFNTTAPTATKPPLDNLQLVYMWLCTALLYEVVEDSIFLLENYGLPSDTRQRDHFENQNVRITSSEADKIKRNTTNLTLVLDSTLLSKLRFHTMNEVKSVHPRCIL